jgi:hypothetical protein
MDYGPMHDIHDQASGLLLIQIIYGSDGIGHGVSPFADRGTSGRVAGQWRSVSTVGKGPCEVKQFGQKPIIDDFSQ